MQSINSTYLQYILLLFCKYISSCKAQEQLHKLALCSRWFKESCTEKFIWQVCLINGIHVVVVLVTYTVACNTAVGYIYYSVAQLARLIVMPVKSSVSLCVHWMTIGVARILSGGALFSQKSLRPFFSRRPLKDRLNIPPNLSHQAKTVLKIDSCSGWGCTFTFFL